MPDETTTVLSFAVEGDPNNMDVIELRSLAFVLSMLLPDDTAEYTYAWAEELPMEFALQNYSFTIVATPVEVVPPETSDEPGTSDEPEVPGTSEEPGTSDDEGLLPTLPSISDIKETLVGCVSGIDGISFGIIALGLGVMKLFKKKDE